MSLRSIKATLTKKGETQQEAIKRVMEEMNIHRPVEDFFVIFLNLYGNQQAKKIEPHKHTALNIIKDSNTKDFDEDENVFLTY